MNQNTFSKQLQSLEHKKQLMIMLIFLLVIVVVWTSLSLFRSRKKVAISRELRELAKPLNPVVNREIIQRLENKRAYSASDLSNFPIYKILTSKDKREAKLVNIESELEELELTPTPAPPPTTTPTLSQEATGSAGL